LAFFIGRDCKMQSSFVFLMIRPGKCRGEAAAYVLMDLPVRGSRILRADFKNRHFARKREPDFTGRFEKTAICP